MHRFGLAISAIVGLCLLVGPARAGDSEVCAQASASRPGTASDEIIAACTRIIDSRQATGRELAAAYRNRGMAWSERREPERAAADLKEALNLEPGNRDALNRVFLASLASGAVDEATTLAQRELQVGMSNPIARLVLGVRAIKQRQYPIARREIAQSVRGQVTDLAASLLSAWTQANPREVRAAINSIDRLSGPNWYNLFKELHAALILDLAGQRDEAAKRAERAYRLDPTTLRIAQGYASLLSRQGESAQALQVLAAFDETTPRHPLIVAAMEEINAGRELAPMVESPQAGAAEVLYGLGAALARRGGDDLGLVYLQLALDLAPSHQLALLSLADLYEAIGKPDRAIRTYERVPPGSPFQHNALVQIALNLDTLDRTDEAKARLEKLIAADPRDFEALMALGNVLRGHKQFAECADVYSRGIDTITRNRKSDWTIYYYRGICYERAKQWPKAEADLKEALELNPEQPFVLNYLGYSWIDRGLNLEEGMSMIRRAVAQRGDDGYIVDSLGWAHFRLGDMLEAIKQLERAVALKPEDPTINDHLGDAYWRIGRKDEARRQWARARELKPEPEDLGKIEAKLSSGSEQQTSSPAQTTAQPPAGSVPPGPLVAVTPTEPTTPPAAAAPALLPPDNRVANETLGLELGNMSDDLRKRYNIKDALGGVVITGIHASSPAADKPWTPGNVIIEIADEAVGSVEAFRSKLDRMRKEDQTSALLVVAGRDGEQWFVRLSIVP